VVSIFRLSFIFLTACGLFEWKRICAGCLNSGMYYHCRYSYQEERVGIQLASLTHLCACPKPGPGFSQSYVMLFLYSVRDRPFNLKVGGGVLVFCFVQNFFFPTTQELEYFFPEFNIRLYVKNSQSNYFFFLHQNQNIFFSNIGNQNIFLEKNPSS
jgi:hypothetical protein